MCQTFYQARYAKGGVESLPCPWIHVFDTCQKVVYSARKIQAGFTSVRPHAKAQLRYGLEFRQIPNGIPMKTQWDPDGTSFKFSQGNASGIPMEFSFGWH